MGTHGRSGVMRLLMASIAERVHRHAPCPTLTYREVVRLVAPVSGVNPDAPLWAPLELSHRPINYHIMRGLYIPYLVAFRVIMHVVFIALRYLCYYTLCFFIKPLILAVRLGYFLFLAFCVGASR